MEWGEGGKGESKDTYYPKSADGMQSHFFQNSLSVHQQNNPKVHLEQFKKWLKKENGERGFRLSQ
jgi:hypothetical protein